MSNRLLIAATCMGAFGLSACARSQHPVQHPAHHPAQSAAESQSVEPVGRVIELGQDIRDIEDFVLEASDTLVVRQTLAIVATGSIVLRGKVVVELPVDAPQGARGPRLQLVAGQTIVLLGEMAMGDGRAGIDEGVMGGTGGSLYLYAPIIGVGIAGLTMGDGARGGPNVEGGGGGTFETFGWVVPFHDKGFTVRGGRGGDGGDGLPGHERHPRGRRGGDGGIGGAAAAWVPPDELDFETLSAAAFGIARELDPFVGPDRLDRTDPVYIGGDGGDGGNGGDPWEDCPTKAGGGRGGEGGMGGYASGARGTPGAPPKFDADGRPHRFASSMHGQRGGNAIGGNGGRGGQAGKGQSLYVFRGGGIGGDGGEAFGGIGGAPPTVPPGTPERWVGGAGPGGGAQGGSGGHGGNSNHGGNGGHSTPGHDGTWKRPQPPKAESDQSS